MRYYRKEHILRYHRFSASEKAKWSDIQDNTEFENFSSRAFLETAVPRLQFSTPEPTVLEYGCGTGPGACFLAQRGLQVDGIDLMPIAINASNFSISFTPSHASGAVKTS